MTEEITKICFADDSGKYKGQDKYRFWENFENLNINVWEKDCPKIYNYSKDYNSLPDPDVNSRALYETHIKVWKEQYKKLKNDLPNIKDIERHGNCRCEIITTDKKIILGSDSIMSIYWHRTFGNMPKVMEKISKCKDIIGNDYKLFIKEYLKESNTIGGFILFPRHGSSINQARGMSDKIQDRFDLTLECIRSMYENKFFISNNPLFDISAEDKEFFKMFGSFKNYIDFFCLNSWVNENYEVKDLLSDDGEATLPVDPWHQEILPCDFPEEKKQVKRWWNLYNNLMSRLDARNKAIQALFP